MSIGVARRTRNQIGKKVFTTKELAQQSRNQRKKTGFTCRGTEFTEIIFYSPPLGVLRGHEKKFKNDQNRKIGLNEIKHLQLLIFAKTDFFSRPAPLR